MPSVADGAHDRKMRHDDPIALWCGESLPPVSKEEGKRTPGLFFFRLRGRFDDRPDLEENLHRALVAAFPHDASTLGTAAKFLAKRGKDFQLVDALFERAMSALTDSGVFTNSIVKDYARFLTDNDETEKAVQLFDVTLARFWNEELAVARVTHQLRYSPTIVDIDEAFSQILARTRDNFRSFVYLEYGRALLRQGRPAAAVPVLDRASTLRPTIEVVTLLATSMVEAGSTGQEAWAPIESFLENPDRTDPIAAHDIAILVGVQEALAAPSPAFRAEVERVWPELDERTKAVYASYVCSVYHENAEARRIFDEIEAATSEDAAVLFRFAVWNWSELGSLDAARSAYTRLLRHDPDHGHALGNLAQLHYAAGDVIAGRAAARRALFLLPEGDNGAVEACFYLYAHSSEDRAYSGNLLRQRLTSGAIRLEWSFASDLARISETDPGRQSLLRDLAAVLNGDTRIELTRHDEWRILLSAELPTG